MQVFLDGLAVLAKYAGALSLLTVVSLGMGVWVVRLIIGREYRYFGLFLALSLCIGIVPLACLAMMVFILDRLLPGALPAGMVVVTLLGAVGLLAWLALNRAAPKERLGWLWLVGGSFAFLLLLVVRLAFLQGLLLPPYSDGVVHYLLVRDLLQPGSVQMLTHHSLANILKEYYHFGFHSLAAWLTYVTALPPQALLPLLGQWFVCLPPLGILCFIVQISDDWSAGLFTALLAAMAWKMPAFAANWAKYPALSGLAIFPAALALFGMLFPVRGRLWAPFGAALLVGGMLILHARLAVMLGIAVLCLLLVHGLERWLSVRARPWLAAGAVLGAAILFIFQADLLWVYGGDVFLPLALTAALLPFAVLRFPLLMTGAALYSVGLILALWLPAPESLQFYVYGAATWLDMPFLSLCFYLPLSMLAGLGAAGLWRILASQTFLRVMLALVVAETAIGSLWNSDTLSPNSCCNYVQESDLQTIEWLKQNLPPDARIVAAGLLVPGSIVSTDAGVWAGVLTGHPVFLLPYDYAWDDREAREEVCTQGDVYIYADSHTYSFSRERLTQQDWYQPLYIGEDEVIYRTLICE